MLQWRLQLCAIAARNDERAGAELVAAELEVFFRRLHFLRGVLEAELHQVVVGGVLDDERRAGALDAARRRDVSRDERHRRVERALVGERLDHQVAHVLERPSGVVVRARVGGRVVLALRQPLEELAAERFALLGALLLLEVGAVEIGLERGGNLAVVAPVDFPGEA